MKKYKVISIKYDRDVSKNLAKMEEEFNTLGQEGWTYKGQVGNGSYFVFEKDA